MQGFYLLILKHRPEGQELDRIQHRMVTSDTTFSSPLPHPQNLPMGRLPPRGALLASVDHPAHVPGSHRTVIGNSSWLPTPPGHCKERRQIHLPEKEARLLVLELWPEVCPAPTSHRTALRKWAKGCHLCTLPC